MIFLKETELNISDPQFVWKKPGYYQTMKSGGRVTFFFDNFPRKSVIYLRASALVAMLIAVVGCEVYLGLPKYAVVLPLGAIVVAIIFQESIRRRRFKDSRIELQRDCCTIVSSCGPFEIRPLVEVYIQERGSTRDGYPIAERTDVEVFLVTQKSEGQRLYFPLCFNGTSSRLAADIVAVTGCNSKKEYIK
jgi:hypothetical protein